MLRYVINGTPPTVNRAYYFMKLKRGKRIIKVKTKSAKEWFEIAKKSCHFPPTQKFPIYNKDKVLFVKLKFYFKDKRKHDIDNYQKLTLDAFTKIIWFDDNQIKRLHSEKFYDPIDPRTVIEVEDMGVNMYEVVTKDGVKLAKIQQQEMQEMAGRHSD